MQPFVEIFLWAFTVSLISVILYRIMIDPEKMREIKKNIETYKEKMTQAQKSGDTEKTNKYLTEMMSLTQMQFKESMKLFMVSSVIILSIFYWLSMNYGNVVINLPFSFPFIGLEMSWFWWYILVSLPATWILRKIIGIE